MKKDFQEILNSLKQVNSDLLNNEYLTKARVNRIIKAREQLTKAHLMSCECSSFQLQYNQGCHCDKGDAIDQAKHELRYAINGL